MTEILSTNIGNVGATEIQFAGMILTIFPLLDVFDLVHFKIIFDMRLLDLFLFVYIATYFQL